MNFHVPSNVTSAPFTLASTSGVSLSWSLNPSKVHVPSFSVSFTVVCVGAVGVTVSPSFLPVCWSGVKSVTAFGRSLPSVADTNSCFTLNSSCTKIAVKVRGSVITACFNCSSVIFSPAGIFVPSFNVISLSAVQWLNLYPSFAFVSVPFGFDLSSTSSFVLATKFSPSLTSPLPSVV